MKTYYSVEYVVQGIGTSDAWFDNKADALKFYNAGDYRDKPVAHRLSNPEAIDEHDLLVAQAAERIRRRREEGEYLLSQWGGSRPGAGRPAVEDKKTGRSIKFSYAEWEEAKDKAESAGMTVSEYIRRKALE